MNKVLSLFCLSAYFVLLAPGCIYSYYSYKMTALNEPPRCWESAYTCITAEEDALTIMEA